MFTGHHDCTHTMYIHTHLCTLNVPLGIMTLYTLFSRNIFNGKFIQCHTASPDPLHTHNHTQNAHRHTHTNTQKHTLMHNVIKTQRVLFALLHLIQPSVCRQAVLLLLLLLCRFCGQGISCTSSYSTERHYRKSYKHRVCMCKSVCVCV